MNKENENKDIPAFAFQPAKGEEPDVFDPLPYDKLLNLYGIETETEAITAANSAGIPEAGAAQTAAQTMPPAAPAQTAAQTMPPAAPAQTAAQTMPPAAPAQTAAQTMPPAAPAQTAAQNMPPAAPEPAAPSKQAVYPQPEQLITQHLSITELINSQTETVEIEEDILVPDTKPDMAEILSISGKVRMNENRDEQGVHGEIQLQTLYLPERYPETAELINIDSKVQIKEKDVNITGETTVYPEISGISFSVINERKFRVKIRLKLLKNEYRKLEKAVFKGIKDEELQLLEEEAIMTHLLQKKKDTMEIIEDLKVKDTQPEPEKILKSSIHAVENYKQISENKVVINGNIYTDVLYKGKNQEGNPEYGFHQSKTEFTQFISINGNPENCRINISTWGLRVDIYEDEETLAKGFRLEGCIETSIETYQTKTASIVTDAYDRSKDIQCEKGKFDTLVLGSLPTQELSLREIHTLDSNTEDVKKILHVDGKLLSINCQDKGNKNQAEGILCITLLCSRDDITKKPICITKNIPFKTTFEVDGRMMQCSGALKEIWVEKINGKQLEISANLVISGEWMEKCHREIIENIGFVQDQGGRKERPGIVVCIVGNDENIWSIAKKHRTTMESIAKINGLLPGESLKPGRRLLVVN